MKKLLVVCMGNICRSPMALAVLRTCAVREGLAADIAFDSAGTHASRYGEKPDPRAEAALLRRGYELGRVRSRKVSKQDFSRFDLILAMDSNNLTELRRNCPPDMAHKLHLYLKFGAPPPIDAATFDVPDPYYGGTAGFARVLDLCESRAIQILRSVREMP